MSSSMALYKAFFSLIVLSWIFVGVTSEYGNGNTLKDVLLSGLAKQVLRPDRGSAVFDHCPNGSIRHDNSCYMASHELANWPDSLVYCEAYGAHLLTIESASEQNFVANMLKSIGAGATDPNHYYWIGGTDAVSEGEWYWAKTVEKVVFTNWSPGQPDNSPAHASHHQDCMALYSDSGYWDDGWCETQHNFVCEIDLAVDGEIIG